MARDKARYVGDGTGTIVPDFPVGVRRTLCGLYEAEFTADEIGEARDFAKGFGDQDWRSAHAADEFVSELLAVAYPLKVTVHRYKKLALKKGDLKAEYTDLLKSLRTTSKKLRSISADLDSVLEFEPAPKAVAADVDELVTIVTACATRLAMVKARQPYRSFSHETAKELVVVLAAVHADHGFPIDARALTPRPSPFMKAIKCIGDAVGLRLDAKTWANTVSKVNATRVASR